MRDIPRFWPFGQKQPGLAGMSPLDHVTNRSTVTDLFLSVRGLFRKGGLLGNRQPIPSAGSSSPLCSGSRRRTAGGRTQGFLAIRPETSGSHHIVSHRSSPTRHRTSRMARATEKPAYSAGFSSALAIPPVLYLWLPSLTVAVLLERPPHRWV